MLQPHYNHHIHDAETVYCQANCPLFCCLCCTQCVLTDMCRMLEAYVLLMRYKSGLDVWVVTGGPSSFREMVGENSNKFSSTYQFVISTDEVPDMLTYNHGLRNQPIENYNTYRDADYFVAVDSKKSFKKYTWNLHLSAHLFAIALKN